MKSNIDTMPLAVDDHKAIADLTVKYLEGLKDFRKGVHTLRKNELERVLIASIEDPLETTVKLTSEREQEVAKMAITLKGMYTHLTLMSLTQDPRSFEEKEKEDEVL